MSLTDVMSGMKLTIFPQIALVIFALTFAAILIRVCTYSRSEIGRRSRLPLDDEPGAGAAAPPHRQIPNPPQSPQPPERAQPLQKGGPTHG